MAELEKTHLQERSKRSAEQILDAAITVIANEGYPAFTMNAVAEVSGGSIGKVYARYSNKEALLYAVKDRTYRLLEAKVETDVAEAESLTEIIGAFITSVSAEFFASPKLYSFVVSHSADDPELHGRGFDFHRQIRGTFLRRLRDAGVDDEPVAGNVYEMIIQSLLMRVLSLGVVAEGSLPYPGFPAPAAYQTFLITTATDILENGS